LQQIRSFHGSFCSGRPDTLSCPPAGWGAGHVFWPGSRTGPAVQRGGDNRARPDTGPENRAGGWWEGPSGIHRPQIDEIPHDFGLIALQAPIFSPIRFVSFPACTSPTDEGSHQ
jgi:hypothetical protein